MGRRKGSKNKKKIGIAPFEITHEANILKETKDGFVTDDFVPIKNYKASVKILGKTYEATGITAIEAITNLKPQGMAKGMSILTISKGDKKREKILLGFQTFRLFSGGRIMREMAIKNISMVFEDL